jgi:hypothetical protein
MREGLVANAAAGWGGKSQREQRLVPGPTGDSGHKTLLCLIHRAAKGLTVSRLRQEGVCD